MARSHPPAPFFSTPAWPLAALAAAALAGLSAGAHAQARSATPEADPPAQAADGQLQDVVVLGVRGERRTVADSPAPIDVISQDQLLKTGRAELGEALAKLLPSFNFGTNQAGINSIVRPVTNRGLGPAYTLVLVNGKRRHNGSLLTNGGGDTSGVTPVDLDMIPLSAVQRVEVLKDSAAAQYGSDAVAGVVNLVLKAHPEGGHVGLTGGRLGNGSGNLSTWKLEGDLGQALGEEGGFVHWSADARKRGNAWWNFLAPAGQNNWSPASNPKNAGWNRDSAHNGDPGIEAWNLAYNAQLPLSSAVTLYSFATLGQRDTVIGNNFRRANGLAGITQIFPNGYFPLNNTSEWDGQIVAGAKGLLAGWDWDASLSWGRNRNRQYSDLTINPSLGPASPTRFDELATYQFEQLVANLDLTRAVDVGWARPLQVSWGAELRSDRFSTYAGDPLGYVNGGYVFQAGDQEGNPNLGQRASPGAQAAVTLSPADEARLRRNSVAAYLDLGFYPSQRWFVDVAARAEHYDDASGSTLSGKVNSRYDFTPDVAVRGTVGTGFRAPSLSQVGYAQTDNRTATNPVTGVIGPSLSKLARNDSALARALGAEDLKPERSRNLGLGLVLQPAKDSTLTIDGYVVEVKDRIIRTGQLTGAGVGQVLVSQGYVGSEIVQYFANGVSTRTTGLDIVGENRQSLGAWGSLKLNAALNLNRTKITKVKDRPAALNALAGVAGQAASGLVWAGRTVKGDLTEATPHNKLVLGARWALRPVEIGLQASRYGSYRWLRTENPAQDSKFGPKWITDLDLGWAVTRQVKLNLGATNLFNVRPDENGPGDTNGTAGSVYGSSPFAPSGAFYYAKASYDF